MKRGYMKQFFITLVMVGVGLVATLANAQQQFGAQMNYQSQQQQPQQGYQPPGMLPPGSIGGQGAFVPTNMPGSMQYAPVPTVGEQPAYSTAGGAGTGCGVDRNGSTRLGTQGGGAVIIDGH